MCNRIKFIDFQCVNLVSSVVRSFVQLVQWEEYINTNGIHNFFLLSFAPTQECLESNIQSACSLFIYYFHPRLIYWYLYTWHLKKEQNWHGVEMICDYVLFLTWLSYLFLLVFLYSVFVFVVDALGLMLLDVGWLSLGVVWLYKFYATVDIGEAKEIMLGMLWWRISFSEWLFVWPNRSF